MLRFVSLRLWCALLLLAAAQAQVPAGTYSLQKDSDGTKPKPGMAVTLTISGGTCQLQATDSSGANETLNDSGPCTFSGKLMSISLPVLAVNVKNKPYVLNGHALVLPFKVFNEGAGTSAWMAQLGGGGGGQQETEKSAAMEPPAEDEGTAPPHEKPACRAGSGGDLLCSCTKKLFETPDCLRPKCTKPVLTSPGCGPMVSSAACRGLYATGIFKQEYDAVVLGRGLMGAGAGFNHEGLVRTIAKIYYPQVGNLRVGISENPGEYAKIEGTNTLHMSIIAFGELSPAALISTIGHELVHGEQNKERNKDPWTYTGNLVNAMFELEASTWDNGKWKGPGSFGLNKFWTCEAPAEQAGASALRACREWQVSVLVGKMNALEATKRAAAQAKFQKFLNANEFAGTQWFPKHKDWKTMTAPAGSTVEINDRHDKTNCTGVIAPKELE